MASSELPDPPARLELEWLLGAWYVLFSNRPDWRARTHPRIEHDLLEADSSGRARVQVSLRFRSPDLLGRAKHRLALATALADPDAPLGQFTVHGHGLARVSSSRLGFAIVEPKQRWAAVWHSRSSLGAAAGLDIYTRDPSVSQARLDAILAAIREHEFLGSRCGGLAATTQHWFPIEGYRLD
ncbi:MAG: hypothetical protein R6X02_35310 [Enhygromyxa sp.]